MNIGSPTHNEWLIIVFAVFVAMQIIFAKVYWRLYQKNRENFFFNSDILESQKATARRSSESEITKLRGKLAILEELEGVLTSGVQPRATVTGSSVQLPSGYECVSIGLEDPRYGADGNLLEIKDPSGDVVAHAYFGGLDPVQSGDDWKMALSGVILNLRDHQHLHVGRIDSLSSKVPDVWSFWDFLYFSTILQTTVGLGDILPNTTKVRKIVIFHLVAAYGLLIVMVNLVFAVKTR